MEIINPVIVKDGLYVSGSVHVQGTVKPNLVLGNVFSSSAQVVYGEIANIPTTTTVSSDSLSGSLITVTGSIDFTESVGGKYLDLNGYKLYRSDFQFTNTASYLELFRVPTGSSGTIQLHSSFDSGSNYYEWEWVYSDASLILSQSFYGNEYSSASIELSIIGGDLIITNVKNDNIALNTVVKTFSESELLVVNTEKPALLLDLYGDGVSVAYSLRKLRTNYTGSAVRVRNDSNVEVDIGFDAFGNLDTGSLEMHCGAGNGFVSIWYDQSGNGRHVVQATASAQPIIYSTSVVLINNKPALYFNNDILQLPTSLIVNSPSTILTVYDWESTSGVGAGLINYRSNPLDDPELRFAVNNGLAFYWNAAYFVNPLTTTTAQNLVALSFTGSTTATMYVNGSSARSDTKIGALSTGTPSVPFTFGYYSLVNNYEKGHIQEFVFYNYDALFNNAEIRTNINSYYSIY